MESKTVFARLRDILTVLYPDKVSARRIVDDAGLDSSLISFSAHAKNNWHMILTEADKQGKVNDLLAIVYGEYRENSELHKVFVAYRNLIKQGGRISPPAQMPAGDETRQQARSDIKEWFPIAGVVLGALTLLFFMGLVIAGLFGYPVPPDSKFIVVVVLALGSALATSFLGGWAVAEGQLPIPFVQAHPLQISVGGGIAVLVIVLLLGYWIYVGPNKPPLPVVYSMDSSASDMKYPNDLDEDPDERPTNTARIQQILDEMPTELDIREIVVYSNWDGARKIAQDDPDLIIIHASAFYTSTAVEDQQMKLKAFLREMEDTHSRFLIYSRSDAYKNKEEEAKRAYEGKYPFLEGRVDVLYVPKTVGQDCCYWRCSLTRVNLRDKVSALLDLP